MKCHRHPQADESMTATAVTASPSSHSGMTLSACEPSSMGTQCCMPLRTLNTVDPQTV